MLKQAKYHYQLANGYFTDGNSPASMRELLKTLRLQPDHSRAHHLLGLIHMARREMFDAVDHLERAVELDNEFYVAQNNLAAAYLGLCRWDQALTVLGSLVRQPLYGTPWLAHSNLGWALLKQGRRVDAIRHFKKAVFFSPRFCVGFNNLGIAYLEEGRHEDAERALKKALSVDATCNEGYAEPHLHLARLNERMARPGAACDELQDCMDKAPRGEDEIGAGCGHSPVGLRCDRKSRQLGCSQAQR